MLFFFTASCEIVCSNPAASSLSTSHSPTATADGRTKQALDETNPRKKTRPAMEQAEKGNLVAKKENVDYVLTINSLKCNVI